MYECFIIQKEKGIIILKNPYQTLKNKRRAYFIMRLVKRARRIRRFHALIADILENKDVQSMKQYNHHSSISCYDHSIHVAYWNYRICSMLGWDEEAGARAGMLHDLFLYDWHEYKAEGLRTLHGFAHPRYALENARRDFELSSREEDIILKHMFPLTMALPKYRETYIIILTDKICCVSEIVQGLVNSKPYICRSQGY
jgi:uncharacterized protein